MRKNNKLDYDIDDDDDDDDNKNNNNLNQIENLNNKYKIISNQNQNKQYIFNTNTNEEQQQQHQRDQEYSMQYKSIQETTSNTNINKNNYINNRNFIQEPYINNYNNYIYSYQRSQIYNTRYNKQPAQYLQLKLSDLVDPDRDKTFIDNLYAQFVPNTNLINLVYVPPGMGSKVPDNSVLLNNKLLSSNSTQSILFGNGSFTNNVDTNKLLNEFYLNALNQNLTSNHINLLQIYKT